MQPCMSRTTIVELDALWQLFITRVPQKFKQAKTLIQSANLLTFDPICEGYQGVWHTSQYGDVEQLWLMVRSEQVTKREHHTLNSRMLNQAERSRKTFKKLCQPASACRSDAFAAIEQWLQRQATLAVEATVLEVPVNEGKGRPGKNQQSVRTYYEISSNLCRPLEKRDEATKQLGLFILATNDIGGSLNVADMLST
jgi:transposase